MFLATVSPLPEFQIPPTRHDEKWMERMIGSPPSSIGDRDQARGQNRLVKAMAQGEENALARLYDSLSGPLYSLAFRIINDRAEAEDIIQDVFLQLWQKAGTYEATRGSVFAWAATLTRNRAIDRVRMRKRRSELLAGSAPDLQPAAPAGDLDPGSALWVREKAAAVRAALGQLATDQQETIELAFFSGLTQLEIAGKLNEPLGTIKARIRRGLLKLRGFLPAKP